MKKQVVTIGKDGSISGLQVKPGQGLNLQELGHAETVRASEIVWDADKQAWKIDVIQDAGKGYVTAVTYATARYGAEPGLPAVFLVVAIINELRQMAPSFKIDPNADAPLMFGSYDDAVKIEIAYLDALRVQGIY